MATQRRVPAPRRLLVSVAAAQVIASVRKQCAYALTFYASPHNRLFRASLSILFLHRLAVKNLLRIRLGYRKNCCGVYCGVACCGGWTNLCRRRRRLWVERTTSATPKTQRTTTKGGKETRSVPASAVCEKATPRRTQRGRAARTRASNRTRISPYIPWGLTYNADVRCTVYGVIASAPPLPCARSPHCP